MMKSADLMAPGHSPPGELPRCRSPTPGKEAGTSTLAPVKPGGPGGEKPGEWAALWHTRVGFSPPGTFLVPFGVYQKEPAPRAEPCQFQRAKPWRKGEFSSPAQDKIWGPRAAIAVWGGGEDVGVRAGGHSARSDHPAERREEVGRLLPRKAGPRRMARDRKSVV